MTPREASIPSTSLSHRQSVLVKVTYIGQRDPANAERTRSQRGDIATVLDSG